MTSLIQPQDTWLLWGVIVGGTSLAIWLEQNVRWAARLSGPVLALVLAMLLSNLRLMPTESPAYDFVGAYLVPLAIPLLLFRANARQIVRETGPMFLIFHVSALGTILGALLGWTLCRGWVERPEQIAGIMTASYIGGGVNFFAVKESFALPETLTNPLLVADNFIMAGMFVLLLGMAASKWFRARFPCSQTAQAASGGASHLAASHWRRKEIALTDIARSLAVAFAVVALAEVLRRGLELALAGSASDGAVGRMSRVLLTNKFVLISGVSLIAATIFHRALGRINGPEEIGGYLLYLFLFVIGLPADLVAVVRNVPLLFAFCAVMAVTNLVVTLGAGRLFRWNLEEMLLCVNATLGGPPTAAAMSIAAGWSRLVLPALLVGIWGYVIGTAAGILVTDILSRL